MSPLDFSKRRLPWWVAFSGCTLVLASLLVATKTWSVESPTDNAVEQPPVVLEFSDRQLDRVLDYRKTIAKHSPGFAINPPLRLANSDHPIVVLQSPSRQVALGPRKVKTRIDDDSVVQIREHLRRLPEVISVELVGSEGRESMVAQKSGKVLSLCRTLSELPRLQTLLLRQQTGPLHDFYWKILCDCDELQNLVIGDLTDCDSESTKQFLKLQTIEFSDCRPELFVELVELETLEFVFIRAPVLMSHKVPEPIAIRIASAGQGHLKGFGSPLGGSIHPSLVRALARIHSLKSLSIEDIEPALTLEDLALIAEMPNLRQVQLMLPRADQASEAERARCRQLYSKIQRQAQLNVQIDLAASKVNSTER